MKKIILFSFAVLVVNILTAQSLNPNDDNATTGNIIAKNPNNTEAVNMLSWHNDIARIRIGGMGNGASNGFVFQGPSDTNLFRIMGNGNVGVGTTNPAAKLHVVGDGIRADRFSLSNITDQTNASPWYGLGRGTFTDLSNDDTKASVQLAGYYGLLLKTAAGSLGIHQNGNVGIGTNSPTRLLDVYGDAKIGKTNSRHYLKISSSQWPELRFQTPLSNEKIRIGVAHENHTGYGVSEGDFYVFTSTISSMPLIVKKNGDISLSLKNGNVGIGTNTPDAKLTVKGNIHTQEVKVDLNGAVAPDYVFLEDYNLKSINEVEAYIKDQGHLPNIPSAAEMEQNGIELKQMNLNLLEKIEELTLYTIAQEKQLKEANNKLLISDTRLQTLEDKNKELETRLEKLEKILIKE
ncbi:tail fiber protein [uncultured Aquimarina sp.]|uniref:tail fiber protein n=1 Tax=uncultured Aquimarina sp. TaxID=575652 RepID=UPI00262EE0F4|nr:tail fiber protein [uncultured Aquimarina sp.]